MHSTEKPLNWSHVSFRMDKHFPLKSWTLALTNLKVLNFRKIGDISYVRNFVKNGRENMMLICDYSHSFYIRSMFGVQLRGTAREQFFPSEAKMEQMY